MSEFRDALLHFMERDEVRYDLVHGNFWMSGWVATELRERLRIPAVQIFHAMGKTKRRHQKKVDTSPGDRIKIELNVIRAVDRLIAQCPSERAELVDDYGADPAKVVIIPSAVNTKIFKPVERDLARCRIGLHTEGKVIVYVGRMLPRKDIRNIVRALALLSKEHDSPDSPQQAVTLLVVGGETVEPDPVTTRANRVMHANGAKSAHEGRERVYLVNCCLAYCGPLRCSSYRAHEGEVHNSEVFDWQIIQKGECY